jgi:hypothetical protein
MEPIAPNAKELEGVTKPEPGVMVAKPATAPVQRPIILHLREWR